MQKKRIMDAKKNANMMLFVNIPIGIIGIALSLWAISESRDEHATRTTDTWELTTLTIALFCFVLALIQGNDNDKGWTSTYILTLFAISILALVAFAVGELRQSQPMVDLRLFKNRSFTGSAIVALSLHGGLYSLLFFLSLYLQNYLGFSALDAGMRLIAISGMILISAPIWQVS